jgi:hypothetical protein
MNALAVPAPSRNHPFPRTRPFAQVARLPGAPLLRWRRAPWCRRHHAQVDEGLLRGDWRGFGKRHSAGANRRPRALRSTTANKPLYTPATIR